jgi:RNA polymerase sigma-70 factor, ECF subfamily
MNAVKITLLPATAIDAVPVLGSVAETEPPLLEKLLRAAVAGEPRARERLFAEIHPLVLRYCRARLGRQETVMGSADDVAQDVCLAVVNALPGYALRGLSFHAFVYGIAAHKISELFRAIGRSRAEPVAEVPDTPLVHDGPEHHLLQMELTERLGALLHLLTPRQREVLVLRIAIGLSAEETAEAVGSTPGAVRVTQHRALNRLRGKIVAAQEAEDAAREAVQKACEESAKDPEAAYAGLVGGLEEAVLDLDAGLDDATRVATYTRFTDDLATLLDLDAGLAAITELAEPPELEDDAREAPPSGGPDHCE